MIGTVPGHPGIHPGQLRDTLGTPSEQCWDTPGYRRDGHSRDTAGAVSVRDTDGTVRFWGAGRLRGVGHPSVWAAAFQFHTATSTPGLAVLHTPPQHPPNTLLSPTPSNPLSGENKPVAFPSYTELHQFQTALGKQTLMLIISAREREEVFLFFYMGKGTSPCFMCVPAHGQLFQPLCSCLTHRGCGCHCLLSVHLFRPCALLFPYQF